MILSTTYSPLARLLATLLLAIVVSAPLQAAEPQPAPVKAEEMERLVSTLEDAKARQLLVEQMKGLIATQRATRPEEDLGILGRVSERVGVFSDQVMEAAASIRDAPEMATAMAERLAAQLAQRSLGEVLLTLAVVLAGSIAVDRGLLALLRRSRAMAAPPAAADPEPLTGLVSLLTTGMIDLLPVVAFGIVGWGLATAFGLSGDPMRAALTLIAAYAAIRLSMVASRLLIAPRDGVLRLVQLEGETAEYLLIWIRRVTVVGVLGMLASRLLQLLGLPDGATFFALKAIGLAVTTMVVIFILQNREAFAAALRRQSDEPMFGRHIQGLKVRLADIWHIIAILWVLAIYVVWALQVKGGFEFMLRATILTLVILALAGSVSALLRRAIDRGFAVSQEIRDRFPLLEARANRYLPILHVVLRGTVAVVTALTLAQAWGLDGLGLLATESGRRAVSSLISIAVVLLSAMVVWEVLHGAIERYLSATDADGNHLQRSGRAKTLLPLVRNAVFVLLAVMVTLIVLSELGVNIAPLLAGAGVLGIAIGFGSQKLVQDIITGAFILFEDTIAVGDSVKVGEHAGTVEAISIRAIRIRDGNGALHTVPFSAVTTVVNATKGFNFAVFDIGIAYDQDTDQVAALLAELGEELRADPIWSALMVEPLEVLGVERFDPSSVVMRARVKTTAGDRMPLTREFNRRLKQRFDAVGISMPFPQTQVWIGKAKETSSQAS
ncbi:putative Mechanosensitive ion channel protein [Candidatus Terasakiella magnetica]|nr:putative Mechanosensitive ion channel protein [Candidatus Terasakiella magnetica]